MKRMKAILGENTASDEYFSQNNFNICLTSTGCRVKVGVSLLKHMNDNHHLPVLEAIYHAFISFWREPLQAVSESLKKTHSDCLLEGHADFACACSMEIIRQGFISGKNLAELSDDCKSVAKETVRMKLFNLNHLRDPSDPVTYHYCTFAVTTEANVEPCACNVASLRRSEVDG
jgi:hypothetical protein